MSQAAAGDDAGAVRTTAAHARPGPRWWPRSRAGLWAVALAGLSAAGLVGVAVAMGLGVESGDTFSDNWLLSFTGVAILVSGAGSLVAAVDALARHHDRARTVVAALVVGFLVTLAVLQQVGEGLGWLEA